MAIRPSDRATEIHTKLSKATALAKTGSTRGLTDDEHEQLICLVKDVRELVCVVARTGPIPFR